MDINSNGKHGEGGRRGGKAALITLVVLAVLALAYFGCSLAVLRSEAIYPNTYAAGVNVGGMTRAEAQRALEEKLGAETVVTLRAGDLTREISAQDAGARYDCARAAESAYAYGRENGVLGALVGYLRARGGWHDAQAEFTLENEKLVRDVIAAVAARVDEPTVEYGWTLTSEGVALTAARAGSELDQAAALAAVEEALRALESRTVDCAPETRQPREMDWEALWDDVYVEPVSAQFLPETREITESVTGISFDRAAARSALAAAQPGSETLIPLVRTEPETTTEGLKATLFRDVLGVCTTNIGGTANRLSNVKLAASFCQGLLLMPGDEFSYNGVVGSRTSERGFLPAPVYVGSESKDEVGGGICQVSSTIYHTALLARMEISERHAHRFATGYILDGSDATVYYGSLDFRFVNNTEYPILLSAEVASRKLTVKIRGTKTDDLTAKLRKVVLSTTPYETVELEDPAIPSGTRKESVTPYTGRTVELYRDLYGADGNRVSSELINTSAYRKRDRVYLVAPGELTPAVVVTPVPETPSPSPLPTGEPLPSAGPSEAPVTPDPYAAPVPEGELEPGGDAL